MRFFNYINEGIDQNLLDNIISIFDKLPKSNAGVISKYILKSFEEKNIKPRSENITYITGPMTNLPDDNWATFIYAEKYINGKIFNPAKPHGNLIKKDKGSFKWKDYMIEDIYNLLKCNKIVVLPGYSSSMGAVVEVTIGKKLLNTKIIPLKEELGKNYPLFLKDVKDSFYKDGFKTEFDNIIEPMLLADSEQESSKKVTPYTITDSFKLRKVHQVTLL